MQGLGALPLVDTMLDVVFKADPFAEVLELPARPLPAQGHNMASQSNSPDGASSGAKQPSTRLLCLVPDCGFDLTESTYYLKRHRVCEAHMKAKTVELDGNICRFCQQCGRFQPLTDFNGDRKSCDAALKAHNARRRQMNQDKTVLVNDRRSRGSRAKMQQDAGGGVDAGARVSRRLAARRTTSPWAAAQDAAQQQQQRRPAAGPTRKETRSDGSHTAFAGNSRSPSASMQSSEDPDSQRYPPQQQQQQQFAPDFPPIHSGTASPSRSSSHSRGGGCTAAHGCAQSAQQALSGSSDDSGAHGQQLQPPGFVLDGSTAAKSAAGRSRLGLVASGSSRVPPLPGGGLLFEEQQQQLLSPALCAGMESSPTGSCAGQQGSLADWMTQHNPADMEQQLQQLWTAAAAAGQPCAAAPSSTAFDCVAGGNSGLMLSQGSTQQQQSGWPPAAGQAGPPAADVWSALPQAPLLQGSVPDQQQQQLSPPQQQEQCWVSMLLDTDMEPATAAPAPATSGNNSNNSNGSSPAGDSLHAAPTAMGPLPTLSPNSLRQSASSAAPAPAAAAAGAGGSGGCPGVFMGAPAAAAGAGAPDGCAGVFMGAPNQQAGTWVEPLDPLDSSLEDALDLLDVMLAEVPEWQLLQPSSAAGTTEAGTSGTRTSSSPGSSDGQLPNPSGRLSDISWADFADLGAAACAEGTTAAACAEGTTAAACADGYGIRQLPAAGAPGAAAAAAGGLVEECVAKPGMLAAAVPAGAVEPAPAAAAGAACGMLAGASMTACGPQAAHGMLPASPLQAYAPMGVGGTAVAGQPFLAGPSLQPGVSAAPSTAMLPAPGFNPPAIAAQLGAPAVCGQQAPMVMTGLHGNNSLGWAQEPVCQPAGVAAGVSPAAAAVPGMQPNSTAWEQQKQQLAQPLLPADPSLALLQQEQLLSQHQLQQQRMLQQLHWQQRQQLLHQHTQLKHYLVRLSVKLHGVMPEQLPSHTVQAMERLVLENAGLMDAIMLQPSFRQGCVQMEFDLLVKPHGPMPAHHAAGQPVQQEQQQGGAAGDSSNSKRMQAAGEWCAVAAALSSCPGTAAAEAQLRQALPFSLLLETLLALPLLPSRAGSAVSEADLDSDLDSTADGDSSAGLPYDSQDSNAGSEQDCWDSGSLPSLTASESSARTAGSAVRAVYAQVGDSVGIWTAAQGLVQEWTPMAGTAVGDGAVQEHSSAASAGAGLRPALVTAGPLCSAPTAGQHMTQLGSLSPVLLQSVVQPGSSSPSCADLTDDTASSSDSQHSSSHAVKLWCTAGGEFVPLATRPAADSAAAGPAAGGSVTAASSELLLGLQSQHMPGMLLLQAEQLHASSARNGGMPQHSSGQALLGGDPLPLKSAVLPVVVCPSAKVAAEVRSVLLSAASPPDAASLLQQLGLLLDFRRMLQQQQEDGPKTDRQQWASGLLSNPSYLEVMRSTCLFWLMFAGIHDMTATAPTLLSIWCSVRSSSAAAAQAPVDDASPAGSEQGVNTAVAEEPSTATQQSPSSAAAAAGAGTAAESAAAGPEPAAAALVQRTPVDQWVFEDVTCGSSSGKRSSSAVPTQEVSTQTPGGHLTDARPGMSVGVSRLLSAFSVLVVLLAVLVAKHTGWLPHALNLLHAMWVPLVVLTAGSILGLIVLWQQPGSGDVGGDYRLLSDEAEPCSKLGSAGGKYAAAMGGVAEDEH